MRILTHAPSARAASHVQVWKSYLESALRTMLTVSSQTKIAIWTGALGTYLALVAKHHRQDFKKIGFGGG
jgi:hypothetical protein